MQFYSNIPVKPMNLHMLQKSYNHKISFKGSKHLANEHVSLIHITQVTYTLYLWKQ